MWNLTALKSFTCQASSENSIMQTEGDHHKFNILQIFFSVIRNQPFTFSAHEGTDGIH